MRFATAILLLTFAMTITSAQAQYGVEFTAPDTFKAVRPDSTAIFHVHIRNSGSVQDTFRIAFSRQNMPANWIPLFCDSFICYDPPFDILLDAGESFANDPHVSIIAWQDLGSGWVECQVRSWGTRPCTARSASGAGTMSGWRGVRSPVAWGPIGISLRPTPSLRTPGSPGMKENPTSFTMSPDGRWGSSLATGSERTLLPGFIS